MKKLLIAILLISLVVLPAFATGDSETKTLTVYAGMLEEHAAAVCQAFEAETGIKTNFVRMSGGEIYARIKAEKENPQASVWYGGGSLTFIEAANEGLLIPYTSPATEKIPTQFKDSEGYWTGIYTGYLGFYADKDWLESVNMDMPDSWEDLLDPRLEGEIVMAHPGSSSTAYNMLTTVLQVMGEEEGWQYLQKLNKNIRQYTKSGSAGGRMVQLRETGLTIGYLHDAISFKREGYDHIVMSAPSEGTGYEIGAVGIIEGAPELEEAKQFVDFVLRSDVQEIGQTVNALQFLTNPDAVPPTEVESIKDAKLITQDDAWSGANRSEFLEKFNELTKTTIPTN